LSESAKRRVRIIREKSPSGMKISATRTGDDYIVSFANADGEGIDFGTNDRDGLQALINVLTEILKEEDE